MNNEIAQKRVTLAQTIIACATTIIVAIGGSVAWATSFQTKAAAAQTTIRLEAVETAQTKSDQEVQHIHDDSARVESGVSRLDDKVDRVLLMLSRGR